MQEEWKPIPDTKHYAVSNHGRVRNDVTGKVLTPRRGATGYQRVHLPVEHGRKDFYIHRLVAEAFCDHPVGCDVVNHIDFNVRNNRADNLEWTTPRGNVLHSMKAGRVQKWPNAVAVVGEKDGEEKTYRTSREAAEATGCDHSSIVKCCKGKNNSVQGYKWRYAEVII